MRTKSGIHGVRPYVQQRSHRASTRIASGRRRSEAGRTTIRSPTPLLLFLLLVTSLYASAVTAQTVPALVVDGLDVEAPLTLEGRLGGFVAASTRVPDEPVPLEITAERLVIRTEHETSENKTPLTGGLSGERWTTTEVFTNATLNTSRMRMSYDIFVAPYDGRPAPAVLLAGDALSLTGQGPEHVQHNRSINGSNQTPQTVPVGFAQFIERSAHGTELNVTGDFQLAFWEWDLTLTTDNQTRQVRSGSEYNNTIDNPLGRNGFGDAHYRYVTMFLTNATLLMDPSRVTWDDMAIFGDRLTVDGDVRLRNAVERSSGQDTGEDRTLAAPVDLALDGYEQDDDRFLIKEWVDPPAPQDERADGTSGSSNVGDGNAVVAEGPGLAPESGRPGGDGFPAAAWAVVAGTPMVAAVLWLAGRSLLNRRIVVLRRAMEAADYGTVARAGPFITRSRRHAAEVAVMKTVALLKLGREADADAFLDRVEDGGRLDAATHSYLEACIAAGRDDLPRARAALEASLAREPGLREAAMRNPYLSGLVQQVVAPQSAGSADDLDGYA